MTVIDGFPLSAELIAYLKEFAPATEHEDTAMTSYVNMLQDIQNYFCRNLHIEDEDQLKQISVFLECVVFMKDDLSRLIKLLPIIKEGAQS